MSLQAKKLTAQQAGAMWRRFYKAYGPEVMRDAYWWETPRDATMGPGEHVWTFYDDVPVIEPGGPSIPPIKSALIGWGSAQIQLDVSDDDEAVLAAGVFPQYQRRGYRTQILDWLCDWAKEQGAEYAITNTNNCNKAQIARKIREAKEGGPWLLAGERYIPAPGYTIFVRLLTPEDG
jgi:GNAT superfamily N-acetyltransferase